MTTYYLSGPMRGKPDYNYPQFLEVEKALSESLAVLHFGEGWEIINPARNFEGRQDLNVTDYMNQDLKQVLDADVIVLLPDWRNSQGARREVQLAIWAGKEFMIALAVNSDWVFPEIDVPVLDDHAASPRGEALDEAKQLITGDRNNAYGPPTQDFRRTAAMASAFGFQVNSEPLQAHHVAIFMILLKMSRLAWTPAKRDSWVDTAGYAGCGFECALEEEKK